MRILQTAIFRGATKDDATDALNLAIADRSFPADVPMGFYITHREVIPGAMQQSSYELHVTAWVEMP